MTFSKSKITRDQFLSRYLPHWQPAAQQPMNGLSGGSCILASGAKRLVLRQPHDLLAPHYHFHRQYRALNRLPASLAPRPQLYRRGWMTVEYLDGEVYPELPATSELATLLHQLHQQPRFGWRVTLLPLLEKYWQQSAPGRRNLLWLRQLKRLRQTGEPRPLRLVPLHLDIHAGNLLHTPAGLRLIDWEYAADGDLALELAALWLESTESRRQLVTVYAGLAKISADRLWHQVTRWRPWVLMLMAGWYEMRWQQSGDKQFIKLADETFRQLQQQER